MALHTLPGPPAPTNSLPLHFPPENVSSKPPVLIALHHPVHNLRALSLRPRVPAPVRFEGGFRALWLCLLLLLLLIFGGLVCSISGCTWGLRLRGKCLPWNRFGFSLSWKMSWTMCRIRLVCWGVHFFAWRILTRSWIWQISVELNWDDLNWDKLNFKLGRVEWGTHHCEVEEKVLLQKLSLRQLLFSRGSMAREGDPGAPGSMVLDQLDWLANCNAMVNQEHLDWIGLIGKWVCWK